MSDNKLPIQGKIERRGSKKGELRGNAGKGRVKGAPNKATTNAREAIARFVDANSERLQEWLDQIAETDGPKDAFRCLMDVMEYHVPKLARTELTGANEGPIKTESTLIIEPVRPRE